MNINFDLFVPLLPNFSKNLCRAVQDMITTVHNTIWLSLSFIHKQTNSPSALHMKLFRTLIRAMKLTIYNIPYTL